MRSWISGATLAGLAALAASCAAGVPGPPPAASGTVTDRSVPIAVSHLPLINQHGTHLDLASFRGKTVMVVPFLTLCTDICPLDTGNLLQVERGLRDDGESGKVQIIELSVDPERDTPARLAAYSHLTGAEWELVTETPAVLSQFERFFGWAVQRVPEDNPPSIDWWTHKPLTYDINHSDGYVVIDSHGIERFSSGAAPDFHGTLNPTLHRFLTDEGIDHLNHPESPGWKPSSALITLGWMLHRALPAPAS